MTEKEWRKKGEELFGTDMMKWEFKCPMCDFVASTQDYKDAGASPGAVGFSCIGRYSKDKVKTIFDKHRRGNGPCDYAGGGLFKFNPVKVKLENGDFHEVFEFGA